MLSYKSIIINMYTFLYLYDLTDKKFKYFFVDILMMSQAEVPPNYICHYDILCNLYLYDLVIYKHKTYQFHYINSD